MIYLHGRPYGLRQHVVESELTDRAVTFVVIMLVDCRIYPMFAALFSYGLVTINSQARAAALALTTWLLTVVLALALAARGGRGPAETLLRRPGRRWCHRARTCDHPVVADLVDATSRATPSRVDRVWLALPFVLLLAGLVATVVSSGLSSTETGLALGLGVALVAWHTWWTVRHSAWLAVRLGPVLVYFLGLIAVTATLFWLSFDFFPLYLVCYPMAFVALPGWWSYGGVALTTAVALLGPGLLTLTPQNVIVTVAGATLAAVAGGSIRALEVESERRRAANAQLTLLHTELESALADNLRLTDRLLVEAREAGSAAERARLASDLHDNLAAGLSGILAQLDALDAELPSDSHQKGRVGICIDVARECLREARHSVAALRPARAAVADLPTGVRLLAEQMAERFDLPVAVQIVGNPAAQPTAEVRDVVLRAAREALTNVAKHAGAAQAYVTVSYLGDRVAVDIADDGNGRPPVSGPSRTPDGPGHGLAIMAERLAAVGGSVQVAASPEHGTTVTVSAPCRPAQEGHPR